MKFGGGMDGATICGTGGVAAPPLHKNAAAIAPNNATPQGIAIAQIAPADKPLLLLFGWKIILELLEVVVEVPFIGIVVVPGIVVVVPG